MQSRRKSKPSYSLVSFCNPSLSELNVAVLCIVGLSLRVMSDQQSGDDRQGNGVGGAASAFLHITSKRMS